MAIPGSKPKIEASAKLRIGVKKVSDGGREYPAAVDYFVGDGVEGKPSSLEVAFVHADVDDAFSTGLEWWIKGRSGNVLACYTKDGGDDPVALRLDQMLDEGQEAIGPPRGQGRLPIACPARVCPHLKDKSCKPMGRLIFTVPFLGPTIYQLDTKSWNSIEKLTGALQVARASGPLNAPERGFVLSVAIVQKGRDRFPVLSLEEKLNRAEALVAAEQTSGDNRAKLIAALRASGRDPSSPAVAAWVTTHGIDEALRRLTEVAA